MKFPIMFISYQDKYSVQNYEQIIIKFSMLKKVKVLVLN
jgi:hypothetical protein